MIVCRFHRGSSWGGDGGWFFGQSKLAEEEEECGVVASPESRCDLEARHESGLLVRQSARVVRQPSVLVVKQSALDVRHLSPTLSLQSTN